MVTTTVADGPIPALVLADMMNMYSFNGRRSLNETAVPVVTMLFTTNVEVSFNSKEYAYPVMLPFLFVHCGLFQVTVAVVLVLLSTAISVGGPVGATKQEYCISLLGV